MREKSAVVVMAPVCSDEVIEAAATARLQEASMSTDDLQERSAFMQAMDKVGMPSWKLQSLMDAAKNRLGCDDECLKQREEQRLLDAWNQSLNTLESAPENEASAERAYVTLAEGPQAYRSRQMERFGEQAQIWSAQSLLKHKDFMKVMDSSVADYSALTTAVHRLRELRDIRKHEYESLDQAVKQRLGTARADDRRAIYEGQELHSMHTYRKILLVIYYLVFVAYLAMGDFFSAQRYRDGKALIGIVLYGITPWIIPLISRGAFDAAHWFSGSVGDSLPKDVYLTR